MAVENLGDSMCTALSCTPNDVAVNRQGRLASSQRYRLLLMATARAAGVVLCGLLLLGAGIPALRHVDFWSVLFVLVFGGLLIATAVLLGRRVINMSRDAIEGKVEQVEGQVTKIVQRVSQPRGGQRIDYFLEFPGKSCKFAVSPSLYKAVISDHYYRAFYAPHSQVIVGMETVATGASVS
jgi:hypothetical protein